MHTVAVVGPPVRTRTGVPEPTFLVTPFTRSWHGDLTVSELVLFALANASLARCTDAKNLQVVCRFLPFPLCSAIPSHCNCKRLWIPGSVLELHYVLNSPALAFSPSSANQLLVRGR